MIIGVDSRSRVPPFEQVRAQIAAAIESGQVLPEQRLPTVRQLAADLRLAVNTVARAYQELEAVGLVETRGRHGTFVAGQPSAARQQAETAARDFTTRMRRLGLGPQEIIAIVRRQLGTDMPGIAAVTLTPRYEAP